MSKTVVTGRHFMIQLKKQTNNSPALDFENSHLSIQLSLNGLDYAIFDKDLSDVTGIKSYTFGSRALTPEQLLDNVREVFKLDEVLSASFESVQVCHKNSLAVLVPEALYDKEFQEDYLKYSVKVLQDDVIEVAPILENESKNLYISFQNVNEYLKSIHPELSFTHSTAVLLSGLLKYHKNPLEKHFFVNVTGNSLDIVYISYSKLQLYNSFLFYTKEDFIYYILFVMEQLMLNPDVQTLTFLGDIDEDTPLYEMTYKYVRHINFLDVDNFNVSEEFYQNNPEIARHEFFELLHLY